MPNQYRKRGGKQPPGKTRAARARAGDQAERWRNKSGHSIGPCPACRKQAYRTKDAAKAAAKLLYPGEKLRIYQCRNTIWWHMTSQDATVTEIMRSALALAAADGPAAAAWTRHVVAATGEGPTWRELAGQLQWPPGDDLMRRTILAMIEAGWLTTIQRRPRSLRPGPRLEEETG